VATSPQLTAFERARRYERSYHERLYASHALFSPGSWLHRPAAYALESFRLIPRRAVIRALDLGSGVGRHAIPLAQHLGGGGRVVCVDLLEPAVARLRSYAARHGVAGTVRGVVADAETFPLVPASYDFVLSVSCIEHVPAKPQLEALIQRLQRATRENGVHCFMMISDSEWADAETGAGTPPLLEQNLTAAEVSEMLARLYGGWQIIDLSASSWAASQSAGETPLIMTSTCVRFTAVAAQELLITSDNPRKTHEDNDLRLDR
jgi:SAM-dependent methyltransferase